MQDGEDLVATMISRIYRAQCYVVTCDRQFFFESAAKASTGNSIEWRLDCLEY